MLNTCHIGDCREILRDMATSGIRVQMCVTSPPYWGLRDYGIEPSVWGGLPECEHVWGNELSIHRGGLVGASTGVLKREANLARDSTADRRAGQFCECGAWLGTLGLEPDYRMYVDHMVEVMELVRDVLADDGTLWLNLGDSYHGGNRGKTDDGTRASKSRVQQSNLSADLTASPNRLPQVGLKSKDLCLMPARVAIALQEAGWWVRSDIIWHKPNPMPESVTDRPTNSHEYIFLLSKSATYYYDAEAIKEACESGQSDIKKMVEGKDRIGGKHKFLVDPLAKASSGTNMGRKRSVGSPEARNRRSVWTVATQPYPGAHFATFPRKLIEPCILAGSRKGDVVLDPFMGSGTTAQVAEHLGRQWIGCELNPEYLALQSERLRQQNLAL